ncbi:phage tail protein [Paraeggerthella sp. LCP19S3_G8]|uniref:phage tail protein n=1 Tax=Paraeggerthella sp. LCP19S3_G8 TaxID=3440248 RepID=UPI003F9AA82C
MDNIRIAVRDSTDSYNVAFFDNEAGIKFKTPNLTKFLAGSVSMLSLSFNSKDIDTVKTGCKLSFVYKNKPYWLNIMDIQKNGFKMDLIAYSLVLEINNEQKGSYKPDKAQSIAKYVRIFDPENSLTIGINEVADKSIKLEWTGTNTLLDRLYSIANRFDAEFEFVTETNSDYSLRRHVLNIYRKGNLGKDLTGQPVRVGKDLKVINYSDNIKELYSAVHATGKDGLTIAGLTKTVNDDAGKPLYVTDGAYLRAPQTRNRFPSVGRNSTDNYLLLDLDSTEYETKEALYGYMLAELKKASVPKVSYTAEGSMDGEVGDKMTLIDDLHYDPPLYVQGRISEMTEDIITGRVTETTFTNYERKYSQLSDDLLKRVEELAKEAMPYTLELSTNNGTAFKNGLGSSLITPTLKRGTEVISGASFVWHVGADTQTVPTYSVAAETVKDTQVLSVEAIVGGQVVATSEITFTNVSDGQAGSQGPAGPIGPQGIKGDQGPKGLIGPKGEPAYFFMAYADDQAGTGFSLTDTSKRYMGYYSNNNPTQSASASSYKWVDRSNVVATFMQSTAPANPPEGARWKYTGTSTITVNDSTIKAGEQYLFIGARWVKDVITSDNLQIKDQFINGAMIKNGAVTVDKLFVDTLSAVTSDLGSVTAGNLLLQRSFKAGSSVIPAYKYPDYKTGLFVDNHGLLVNGMPVQKTSSETMASDMPIVAMTAGEVRFSRVDITENLERLLHEGLSDPDFGSIKFGRDSDGRNALVIQVNGQVYLKGQNYTDWSVSTVNRNVRWKVQGNLVIVDYDVTFPTYGTKHIVTVPTKYVSKDLMLNASAWYVNNTKDKKAQLNADGGLHIIGAEANQRYCGQIVWAY